MQQGLSAREARAGRYEGSVAGQERRAVEREYYVKRGL